MAGRACAVILAGGQGARAGRPKQFARAGGKTLLLHSCTPFLECREIGRIVLVVPQADVDKVRREATRQAWSDRVDVVAGGATRHLSSRRGLTAVPENCDTVLIHDAARPFASSQLVRRVLRAARRHGAAIPAIAVHDSMVELGTKHALRRYVPRDSLAAVQTPQGFRRDVLDRAFRRARGRGYADDASVLREQGSRVVVVQGEQTNQKVTTTEDLRRALAHFAR